MVKLIAFFILLTVYGQAETPTGALSDRDRLQTLLKERRERFDGYMQSLQEKSGFFGGKSKKDFQKSQIILVEIVRLDNQMISILNRQLDFKSFEKTEMNYQSLQEQEEQNRIANALALSKKEIARLQKSETELISSIRLRNTLVFLSLITAFLSLIIPRIFQKRKEEKAAKNLLHERREKLSN